MQLQREDLVRIYLSTMLIKLMMWLVGKPDLRINCLILRDVKRMPPCKRFALFIKYSLPIFLLEFRKNF